MLRNVELRKLPAGSLCRITETLQTNGDWKKVMSHIPKNLNDENFEPKYNAQHMKTIEDYATQTNRNCAEILFDEWGTSGKVRPTLKTLQDVVLKAGIYKAADEIALMLHELPPPRPSEGPAAKIDTNISQLLNGTKSYQKQDKTESTAQMKSSGFPSFQKILRSIGNRSTQQVKTDSTASYDSNNDIPNIPNISQLIKPENKDKIVQERIPYPRTLVKIDTTILENKSLICFDYNELKNITSEFSNDFIHGPYGPTGKIGSGGFGDVYAGFHQQHGALAVKKFRNLGALGIMADKPDFIAQIFNSEVKFLYQLRHENIVPIIGYSMNVEPTGFPSLCIVCQYVDGGSLEQNLAAKRLTEKQRLDIMLGTAKGLKYIHNTQVTDPKLEGEDAQVNFLHGDVKTANILLTRDYQAKLCDFGLAKQFNMTTVTESLVGTRPYMSPERLRGTVTQKSDVYSFGIVLLELLTGLQCAVRFKSDIINIQDYISFKAPSGDITEVLDQVAQPWSKGQEVYELAKKCLENDYIIRCSMDQICDELIRMCEEVTAEAVDSVE